MDASIRTLKMPATPQAPSAASPDQRRLLQSAALLQTAGRVAHLGGWMIDVASERVFWSDEVCDIHEVPHGTVLTLEEAIGYYRPAGTPRSSGSTRVACATACPSTKRCRSSAAAAARCGCAPSARRCATATAP